MAKLENDIDIYLYYAVANANTQRQENELSSVMKNVMLQDGS